MHPEGEQSNRAPENNSDYLRPRASTDYTSDFRRRPPLSRNRPADNATQPPTPETIEAPAESTNHPSNQAFPSEDSNIQPSVTVDIPKSQEVAQPTQLAPREPEMPQSEPQRMTFTPPPKKRRSKLFTGLIALSGAIILIGGMMMLMRIQAAKNNPTTVMNDAIKNNLSVKSVEANTKTEKSNISTKYDLTTQKNPITSSSATLELPKSTLELKSYGSAKNTYVSYTKLPKTISKDFSNHTKDGWIQIRNNGQAPKNADQILVNLSDPRYQMFGPLLLGNLPENIQEQLINFVKEHKIYAFNEKSVKKIQVGDQKMFVYEIKPDVSYLKIASQSAAASLGFDPTEVQTAVDKLEQLRGAKVTVYVGAKDHRFAMVKISNNGNERTITYRNYDATTLPDSPQTKLMWPTFAPLQTIINNQTGLTTATY